MLLGWCAGLAPAGDAPTAAAPAEPLTLAGRVLDAEGRPVVCGFVMLEDHPRAWDWTDGSGGFRLVVEPAMLSGKVVASFAGHEPQRVDAAAAPAVPPLEIRLRREDPAFTAVETGCGIALGRAVLGVYSQHRPLDPREATCVAAWQAFLKERGRGLMAKIATGAAWEPGEERYRFMLLAQMAREAGMGLMDARGFKPKDDAQRALCAVRDRGLEAIRSGIRQRPLTAADVEALRGYRALQATVDPNVPCAERALGNVHLAVGQRVRDVAFAEVLPLLGSDRYTDHESLSATESLRLEALAFCLAEFDSYALRDGSLAGAGSAAMARIRSRPYERFVSIQDMLQARRPVLLNWTWTEDQTHTGFNLLYAEYIKRAYRGQVDVYAICESSPPYVDTYFSERMFFGPNPAADPTRGLAARFGEEDFTPAERCARVVKTLCMSQLTISPPLLQSLPGMPFRRVVSGWPTFTLMDRDGVSSVPNGQSAEHPRVQWAKGWATWYTPFEVSGVHHGATTERAIRSLLANGGVRDPRHRHLLPDYPKCQLYGGIRFRIVAVDPAQRVVTAHRQKAKADPSSPDAFDTRKEYRFRLRPDARIEWETTTPPAGGAKAGAAVYGLRRIEDLRPGMTFAADVATGLRYGREFPYDGDVWKEPGLQPHDIGAFARPEIDTVRLVGFDAQQITQWGLYWLMRCSMPLYGTVVSRTADQVTVRVDQEHVRSLLGLRFWREHGPRKDARMGALGPSWEPLRLAERLAVLERWAEGTDADRTYTFALDPAVRLCRNGEVDGEPSALAIGDYVWVMYGQWWETQGLHRQAIHPETIMAAEPMRPDAGPGKP